MDILHLIAFKSDSLTFSRLEPEDLDNPGTLDILIPCNRDSMEKLFWVGEGERNKGSQAKIIPCQSGTRGKHRNKEKSKKKEPHEYGNMGNIRC